MWSMAKVEPTRRRRFSLSLLVAASLLSACSADKKAEPAPPPKPAYQFDVSQSKVLFVDAAALHKAGDNPAAIAKLRRASELFPLDPDPYRLMIIAATKSEDADALRYARFFDARLPTIETLGPWVASLQFKSAGDDNRAQPVKGADIRANARRIAAYLSAMICDEDRKRALSDTERLSYIRRYGVEGLVNRMRLWFEEIPDNCPNVTVK